MLPAAHPLVETMPSLATAPVGSDIYLKRTVEGSMRQRALLMARASEFCLRPETSDLTLKH